MLNRLLVLLLFLPSAAWAEPANPSFYLVNRSGQAIDEVYASPPASRGWGHDRLGSESIAPGGNAPVRMLADGTCVFDLRVVYADGRAEERRNVNTCNVDNLSFGQTKAPPQGQQTQNDPSFNIVNRGDVDLNEVYATLPNTRGWGRDRLGDDTVAAGANRVIHLPAGQCIYDLRFVFDDGDSAEKRRVNLCAVTDLEIP